VEIEEKVPKTFENKHIVCCFSKENDLEGILSIKDERFIFRAYLWLRKTFFPTHDNLKAVEELEMWRKTQTIN